MNFKTFNDFLKEEQTMKRILDDCISRMKTSEDEDELLSYYDRACVALDIICEVNDNLLILKKQKKL